MARSISQIYAEAIYTRNNYLQITELDSGRTKSKMSMLNLITYVMAVLIHTYEAALDVFQVDIATIIGNRINGTPQYYVTIAKYFQFNPDTQEGDPIVFNEDTMKVEYEAVDETHRIVVQSSYEYYEQGIILKVCKEETDSKELDGGTAYTQLSDAEMTAFKSYISAIKFCGAKLYCLSNPGDIITIHTSASAPIYYNDSAVTREQAVQNIKNAFVEYIRSIEFDDYVRYQKIIDVIQNADGVTDVSARVRVGIFQYNNQTGAYGNEINITGRIKTGSGYIKLTGTDGNSTLDSLTLLPESGRRSAISSVSTIKNGGRADVVYTNVDGVWKRDDDTIQVEKNIYTQKYEKDMTKNNMVKLIE